MRIQPFLLVFLSLVTLSACFKDNEEIIEEITQPPRKNIISSSSVVIKVVDENNL